LRFLFNNLFHNSKASLAISGHYDISSYLVSGPRQQPTLHLMLCLKKGQRGNWKLKTADIEADTRAISCRYQLPRKRAHFIRIQCDFQFSKWKWKL